MKNFFRCLILYFLNHIVSHIPFWFIRKFFYKLCGMKIGKHSKILLGLHVVNPWGIKIGNRTFVNENCYLDGRGGLIIGDDVNISIYSKILTGTHKSSSDSFEYVAKEVVVKSHAWIGISAIVLPGTIIPKGMILAAGSVAINSSEQYKENGIYSGVPAKEIGVRQGNINYTQKKWHTFF